MVATPAGIGMLAPPMVMKTGYGAEPLEGIETVAVNDVDFPLSVTETVTAVFETVPVTVAGFGGLSPSSHFANISFISFARQGHCALVVILVPSAAVNGSGIFAFVAAVKPLGRPAHVVF